MQSAGLTRPVATGFAFPECPRWHRGSLWFSDLHAGSVHRLRADGTAETVLTLDGLASGLGWLPGGDMLVVSMADCRLIRLHDGVATTMADLSGHHSWFSNDMLVDPCGRAFIGSIGFDYFSHAAPQPSTLVRVDPDGSVVPLADDMWTPNGMALTPDGRQLFVAESFGYRITAFDVDESGGLSRRRVLADLGDKIPDGICIDASGQIWVAVIAHNELIRIDQSGRVTLSVSTGEREVIACACGGADGRTLYACTTMSMAPEQTLVNRDGCIEAIALPADD